MKIKIKHLFYLLLFTPVVLILTNSCSTETPDPIIVQKPVLTTTAVSNITKTTASGGGNITSNGGGTIINRGVCWSTGHYPTIADNKTTNGSGTGNFISNITGLTANTTYYLRAYATNSAGNGYGNEISFTTESGFQIPVLVTTDVTNIRSTTAGCGGNITSDGGTAITARGICWSTNQNPVVSDSHTIAGTGTGSFTCDINGLGMNIKYYVRAYAINSVGTAYGDQKSFTTHASLEIGDSFAGGYIFYLDGTGNHGYVCATKDQSNNSHWGCAKLEITGAKGTAMGTGAANTASIVSKCTENDCAARHCSILVLNGFSDWFLPSKDELLLMYNNLKKTGQRKFNNGYWSSTDTGPAGAPYDYYMATMVLFGGGICQQGGKDTDLFVRAARAF